MTVPQLERRVNELERLVKSLMQPKSVARIFGTSGSSSKIFKATSGIAARSGTTVSSATCTEFKLVAGTLTTNTNTETIYNLSAVAVPTNGYVIAMQEAITNFWVCEPAIVGLRLSGTTLQYTIDGTTWTTWTTGTNC